MREFLASDVARRAGGRLVGPDRVIRGFATDSRAVTLDALFLCIQGANVDGTAFWPQARENGASVALAETEVEGTCVLVPQLVEGIAAFGRSLRAEFRGPVVGITGSNGKTTTKELTVAALGALGPVLKSPGNQNTEYTSPLAWMRAGDEASAVMELAMRGYGQIRHLATVHRPDVAIITMIGTAHIEMVGSREGIARAKGEILEELPEDGTAVLWQEDDFLGELMALAPGRVRTFGFSPDAECQVVGYRALSIGTSAVALRLDGETEEVVLPVSGRHQALNAAAAALAAHTVGVQFSAAVAGLLNAEWPPMRMEVREIGGVTVVVDTYNASPDSTVAALRALAEVNTAGRRIAVLGEMKELGPFSESGHRMVGRAVAETDLDAVLLTGGPTDWIRDEAVQAGYPAERLSLLAAPEPEAIAAFLRTAEAGDQVLIKGSRALGLERALEWL